ncbi:hypothetical protein D3C87_1786880 [compost metagenome]
MQQATPNLLGSERRKSRPLETLIFQPQLRVSGINCTIPRLGIGNQYAARRHDGFGLLLIPAPEVLADQPR